MGRRRAAVLLGAAAAVLACAGPAFAVKPGPGPTATPYRGNPHTSPTPSPAATSTPKATASPTPVRTSPAPAPAPAPTTTPATSAAVQGPTATPRTAVRTTSLRPAPAVVASPPAPRTSSPRPARTPEETRLLITGRHDLSYAPEAARRIAAATAQDPQLPLSVLGVVLVFLLVQDRIDRKDPKLALAEGDREPELAFGPEAR